MIKKMNAKEFREQGYLQELNRQFLHPLGLALECVIHGDGSESFGEVWDSRDDPEGFAFENVDSIDKDKAIRIMGERDEKAEARKLLIGSVNQWEKGR